METYKSYEEAGCRGSTGLPGLKRERLHVIECACRRDHGWAYRDSKECMRDIGRAVLELRIQNLGTRIVGL